MEKKHKKTIEAMGKASDAEKERCHAALEKAQSDLKISKEKQKDMAAELRFYQDRRCERRMRSRNLLRRAPSRCASARPRKATKK